MSEYGIRIKNIEASTLLEYNRGLRSHYEVTNAMFTNSLFCDYLKENGLKLLKDESTRDIICLEFNFGTRSYEQEMEHLKKTAKKARIEYKAAKSQNNQNEMNKKRKSAERLWNISLLPEKTKTGIRNPPKKRSENCFITKAWMWNISHEKETEP